MSDIDKMTPKQLGIAVATEVMGWRFGYEWEEGDIGVWSDPHPDYIMVLRPAHPDDPYFDVTASRWAPWQDKNDMWEVIEKIHSMLFSIRYRFVEALKEFCPSVDNGKATVDLMWAFLFLMDVPDVVCRAALMAVRQKT